MPRKVCANANHEIRGAVIYCTECKNYYCAECETQIHNVLFASHSPYVLRDFTTEDDPPPTFTGMCTIHKDHSLDLFCATHTCLCCTACMSQGADHCGCDTVPFASVDKKVIQKYVNQAAKDLKDTVKKAESLPCDEIEKKVEAMKHKALEARERIRRTFECLRKTLNEREEELMKFVDRLHGQSKTTKLMSNLKDIDEITNFIKTVKSAKRSWDAGLSKEMLFKATEALKRGEKLENILTKAFDFIYEDISISVLFDDSFLCKASVFGEIKGSNSFPTLKLTAENITDTKIDFSWNAAPFENAVYKLSGRKEINKDNKVLYSGTRTKFTLENLRPGTSYVIQVQAGFRSGKCTFFGSNKSMTTITVKTLPWCWRECPGDISDDMKYSLCTDDLRVASKLNGEWWASDGNHCTILGANAIPVAGLHYWGVKILKTHNNGSDIFIGIAPIDIDQDCRNNFRKCGWYFDCYDSTLWSGPPHNYKDEDYGIRKEWGQYVRKGDTVTVLVDSGKGMMSFVINDVNMGVAYSGIPLNKPLVPCVLLKWKSDTIQLLT